MCSLLFLETQARRLSVFIGWLRWRPCQGLSISLPLRTLKAFEMHVLTPCIGPVLQLSICLGPWHLPFWTGGAAAGTARSVQSSVLQIIGAQ